MFTLRRFNPKDTEDQKGSMVQDDNGVWVRYNEIAPTLHYAIGCQLLENRVRAFGNVTIEEIVEAFEKQRLAEIESSARVELTKSNAPYLNIDQLGHDRTNSFEIYLRPTEDTLLLKAKDDVMFSVKLVNVDADAFIDVEGGTIDIDNKLRIVRMRKRSESA